MFIRKIPFVIISFLKQTSSSGQQQPDIHDTRAKETTSMLTEKKGKQRPVEEEENTKTRYGKELILSVLLIFILKEKVSCKALV